MSLFGTILSKIFPASHPAVTANQGTGQAGAAQSSPSSQSQQSTPAAGTATQGQGASQGGNQAGARTMQTGAGGAAAPQVDVEQVLNDLAAKQNQQLNWRTSIVDLMKLLNMDSSLSARTTLAHELGYTGDTNDSATMNIWLHKQVMTKLAENGGKVPQSMRH